MQDLNQTSVINQDIINFTPNTTSEVAIIAIPVLQRLAQALSSTSLDSIKRHMSNDLRMNSEIDTMEKYLALLQTEIDFHTTVTALMEYKAVSIESTPQNNYL
jgi:hypothetical protein